MSPIMIMSTIEFPRLDLGPVSLLGAQQHTTVEAATALKIQDKIEGKFKAHMQAQILYSIEQGGRNRDMKQMKWHTLIGTQLT